MKAIPTILQSGLVLALALQVVEAPAEEARPPTDDPELRYWLENMGWHHQFSDEEIQQVTGFTPEQVATEKERLEITQESKPPSIQAGSVRMMPYPGGRHPRIGFLEGAIRPQRETKVSVFTPWNDGHDYVVVDVPEALWSNLGLTYLAHTHVETIWTEEGVSLPKMEWTRHEDGSLSLDRTLPNQIRYQASVQLIDDHLEMKLQLTNGTTETLTDLRVQNCVMLKGAPEFEALTNDNKILQTPFAAVHSDTHSDRWIITAWEPCHRPWGNAKVPCLHSDPKFPDCQPGETQTVRGWLSFYEGQNVEAEFERIRSIFFESP